LIPLPQLALALALVLAADAYAPPAQLPAWSWVGALPLWWWAGRVAARPRGSAANAARRVLPVAGFLTQAWASLLGGWSESLVRLLGEGASLNAWPTPAQALAVAPYAIGEAVSLRARSRRYLPDRAARQAWWNLRLRLHLGALLGLTVFLLWCWPLAWKRAWLVQVEEVSALSAGFTFSLALGFAGTFPWMLRKVLGTEPLTGAWGERFAGLARRAGVGLRRVELWRTGGLMPNAAVMGFTRFDRVVLFTDAMLATQSPRQLAAVFGHELGHSLRQHLVYFAAFTLGWAGVALYAADELYLRYGEVAAGVVGAGALAFWFAAFGWLSRRFELEADWQALRLSGDGLALCSSLASLADGSTQHRRSWRYFPVSFRLTWVRAAMRDSEVGERLERGLVWPKRACIGLLLLGLGLQAWSWSVSWPVERARAELRLGHLERAAERAADWGSALDAERTFVERAVRLQGTAPDGPPPEVWTQLAGEAQALGWGLLAHEWALRGRVSGAR
jgi:Zn-dependent protease with chaperone function